MCIAQKVYGDGNGFGRLSWKGFSANSKVKPPASQKLSMHNLRFGQVAVFTRQSQKCHSKARYVIEDYGGNHGIDAPKRERRTRNTKKAQRDEIPHCNIINRVDITQTIKKAIKRVDITREYNLKLNTDINRGCVGHRKNIYHLDGREMPTAGVKKQTKLEGNGAIQNDKNQRNQWLRWTGPQVPVPILAFLQGPTLKQFNWLRRKDESGIQEPSQEVNFEVIKTKISTKNDESGVLDECRSRIERNIERNFGKEHISFLTKALGPTCRDKGRKENQDPPEKPAWREKPANYIQDKHGSYREDDYSFNSSFIDNKDNSNVVNSNNEEAVEEVKFCRGCRDTYAKPLIHIRENEFRHFMTTFYRTIYKRKEECEELRTVKYPNTIGKYYDELVDENYDGSNNNGKISYEDFWQRYFYRCDVKRIKREHKKNKEREDKHRGIEAAIDQANICHAYYLKLNSNQEHELNLVDKKHIYASRKTSRRHYIYSSDDCDHLTTHRDQCDELRECNHRFQINIVDGLSVDNSNLEPHNNHYHRRVYLLTMHHQNEWNQEIQINDAQYQLQPMNNHEYENENEERNEYENKNKDENERIRSKINDEESVGTADSRAHDACTVPANLLGEQEWISALLTMITYAKEWNERTTGLVNSKTIKHCCYGLYTTTRMNNTKDNDNVFDKEVTNFLVIWNDGEVPTMFRTNDGFSSNSILTCKNSSLNVKEYKMENKDSISNKTTTSRTNQRYKTPLKEQTNMNASEDIYNDEIIRRIDPIKDQNQQFQESNVKNKLSIIVRWNELPIIYLLELMNDRCCNKGKPYTNCPNHNYNVKDEVGQIRYESYIIPRQRVVTSQSCSHKSKFQAAMRLPSCESTSGECCYYDKNKLINNPEPHVKGHNGLCPIATNCYNYYDHHATEPIQNIFEYANFSMAKKSRNEVYHTNLLTISSQQYSTLAALDKMLEEQEWASEVLVMSSITKNAMKVFLVEFYLMKIIGTIIRLQNKNSSSVYNSVGLCHKNTQAARSIGTRWVNIFENGECNRPDYMKYHCNNDDNKDDASINRAGSKVAGSKLMTIKAIEFVQDSLNTHANSYVNNNIVTASYGMEERSNQDDVETFTLSKWLGQQKYILTASYGLTEEQARITAILKMLKENEDRTASVLADSDERRDNKLVIRINENCVERSSNQQDRAKLKVRSQTNGELGAVIHAQMNSQCIDVSTCIEMTVQGNESEPTVRIMNGKFVRTQMENFNTAGVRLENTRLTTIWRRLLRASTSIFTDSYDNEANDSEQGNGNNCNQINKQTTSLYDSLVNNSINDTVCNSNFGLERTSNREYNYQRSNCINKTGNNLIKYNRNAENYGITISCDCKTFFLWNVSREGRSLPQKNKRMNFHPFAIPILFGMSSKHVLIYESKLVDELKFKLAWTLYGGESNDYDLDNGSSVYRLYGDGINGRNSVFNKDRMLTSVSDCQSNECSMSSLVHRIGSKSDSDLENISAFDKASYESNNDRSCITIMITLDRKKLLNSNSDRRDNWTSLDTEGLEQSGNPHNTSQDSTQQNNQFENLCKGSHILVIRLPETNEDAIIIKGYEESNFARAPEYDGNYRTVANSALHDNKYMLFSLKQTVKVDHGNNYPMKSFYKTSHVTMTKFPAVCNDTEQYKQLTSTFVSMAAIIITNTIDYPNNAACYYDRMLDQDCLEETSNISNGSSGLTIITLGTRQASRKENSNQLIRYMFGEIQMQQGCQTPQNNRSEEIFGRMINIQPLINNHVELYDDKEYRSNPSYITKIFIYDRRPARCNDDRGNDSIDDLEDHSLSCPRNYRNRSYSNIKKLHNYRSDTNTACYEYEQNDNLFSKHNFTYVIEVVNTHIVKYGIRENFIKCHKGESTISDEMIDDDSNAILGNILLEITLVYGTNCDTSGNGHLGEGGKNEGRQVYTTALPIYCFSYHKRGERSKYVAVGNFCDKNHFEWLLKSLKIKFLRNAAASISIIDEDFPKFEDAMQHYVTRENQEGEEKTHRFAVLHDKEVNSLHQIHSINRVTLLWITTWIEGIEIMSVQTYTFLMKITFDCTRFPAMRCVSSDSPNFISRQLPDYHRKSVFKCNRFYMSHFVEGDIYNKYRNKMSVTGKVFLDWYENIIFTTEQTNKYLETIRITTNLLININFSKRHNRMICQTLGISSNLLCFIITMAMREKYHDEYLRAKKKLNPQENAAHLISFQVKNIINSSDSVEHFTICRSVLDINENSMITRKSELMGMKHRETNRDSNILLSLLLRKAKRKFGLIVCTIGLNTDNWIGILSKKVGEGQGWSLRRASGNPAEMMDQQASSHSIFRTN